MAMEEKELCIMSFVSEGNGNKNKPGKKVSVPGRFFGCQKKTVSKETYICCVMMLRNKH
jgi:hypothetical protein